MGRASADSVVSCEDSHRENYHTYRAQNSRVNKERGRESEGGEERIRDRRKKGHKRGSGREKLTLDNPTETRVYTGYIWCRVSKICRQSTRGNISRRPRSSNISMYEMSWKSCLLG